jgi:hypothetical protein
VAHPAGVKLDRLHTGLRHSPGVHVRVDVRLHHADLQLTLQKLCRAAQCGGFAGAGSAHKVKQKNSLLLQLGPQLRRTSVIVGKDALLDLDHTNLIHANPLLSLVQPDIVIILSFSSFSVNCPEIIPNFLSFPQFYQIAFVKDI